MAPDDMAASAQFLDLGRTKEARRANTASRDQKVRFPPKLIKHVSDVEHRTHAAVVKCQKNWAVCRRTGEQLRSSRRLAMETLPDRHQVLTEFCAIQLVYVGISALEAAQLPATCRNDIMKQ
jgi:hypothetical protein